VKRWRTYVLAFGRRVGEPVGFDDGPNDDDRQRNPCQTTVGKKHKQQKNKKAKKEKKKKKRDAIYNMCQFQQLASRNYPNLSMNYKPIYLAEQN